MRDLPAVFVYENLLLFFYFVFVFCQEERNKNEYNLDYFVLSVFGQLFIQSLFETESVHNFQRYFNSKFTYLEYSKYLQI